MARVGGGIARTTTTTTTTTTNSDYLHIEYLDEFETVQVVDFGKFVHRLNYSLLNLLDRMTYMDFGVSTTKQKKRLTDDDDDVHESVNFMLEKRQQFKLSAKTNSRYHYMSHVILILYLLLGGHLLINLIVQSDHDYSLLRLRKLKGLSIGQKVEQQQHPLTSQNNGTLNKLEIVRLEARMSAALQVLDIIGAPHRHYTMAIECLHLCMIGLTVLLIFTSHIYWHFIAPAPFDVHTIRQQLDYHSELARTNCLIEAKVYEFIESSGMFSLVTQRNALPYQSSSTSTSSSLRRSVSQRGHQFEPMVAQELLMELYESGALRPNNRSLEWFDTRSRLVLYYLLFTIFYQAVYFFYITLALSNRKHSIEAKQHLTRTDIIYHCSFISLISIIGFISCNMLAQFSIACMDQIMAVNKLGKLIERCIITNSRLFAHLMDNANSRSHRSLTRSIAKFEKAKFFDDNSSARHVNTANKMNTNLLFVLMHYKIFVAQHVPTRRSIEPGLFFVTTFQMIIPIVVKIHIPYLVLFNAQSSRYFAAFLCLGTLIPANTLALPLCYMHARCIGLHKRVSSLMAHVAEIGSYMSKNKIPVDKQCRIYDGHLVTILVKELRHPEQFMKQFRPHCLGLNGTFVTHLKIHFWWGLLVLSILFDTQSNSGGLLESLFSDPLNIF